MKFYDTLLFLCPLIWEQSKASGWIARLQVAQTGSRQVTVGHVVLGAHVVAHGAGDTLVIQHVEQAAESGENKGGEQNGRHSN